MINSPESKPKDSIITSLGLATLLAAGAYYLLSLTPYADRYKSPESPIPPATATPVTPVNKERAKRAWIIYTASGAYPKNAADSPSPSPNPKTP